jgi:hypothetical protein
MLRSLVISCLVLCLAACTKAFTPRTIPACYKPSGVAEVDRERSYYALLLALSESRYVVLNADPPRQIVAEYYTSYTPGKAYARWRIDSDKGGMLRVQSIPPEHRHPGTQEKLFGRLSDNTRRMQCRELAWLRWEAQNRGLVPLVEVREPSLAPAPAQFATLPQAVPDAAAPDPLDPVLLTRSLRGERDKIRFAPSIAVIGAGVTAATLVVPFVLGYIWQSDAYCENHTKADGSCKPPLHTTALLVAGSLMAGSAAALMLTGGTMLRGRLQRRRGIDRHLRLLEQPRLGFGADAHGMNLSLRAAF